MKQLFFVCIAILSFWSCSTDDDGYSTNYNTVFIPIEEVVIPEYFVLGNIHQIDISYYRPTNCHNFYDFYYVAEDNERTVAVINAVYENLSCESLEGQLVEKSFDFKATYEQIYVFKFWQGEDANGEDIFLTYEVPTIH